MATEYERWLSSGDKERSTGPFRSALNLLRRRSIGRQRRQVTFDNGSVANPIKGVKQSGGGNITGGAF